MRKLSRSEKAGMWEGLCVLFMGISGFLVLNQFAPRELHGVLPLWVLGLFLGLTILCGLNSWRHSGEQNARKILRKQVKKACY